MDMGANDKPPAFMASDLILIARTAHELNRSYCLSILDDSHVSWEEAPEWQRMSVMDGVAAIMNGQVTSPDGSHANWLRGKTEEGWTYGPVKDPAKKEHPCMVPLGDLPEEQKRKDVLFFTLVSALAEALRRWRGA
jgi:hypothetical protein